MEDHLPVRFWWDDRNLRGGSLYLEEIESAIKTADAVLVLLSNNYLKARFICDVEWPWILKYAQNTEIFTIPIDVRLDQLRQTQFELLASRQVLTPKGIPLAEKGSLVAREIEREVVEFLEHWTKEEEPIRKSANQESVTVDRRMAEIEQRVYLEKVFHASDSLPLGKLAGKDMPPLKLRSVYIHLEADLTPLAERQQTRTLYQKLAAEEFEPETKLSKSVQRLDPLSSGQKALDVNPNRMADILKQRKRVPSQAPDDSTSTRINIQDAFQRNQVLVVLGDPGSGKSVLCKWLLNQLSGQMLGYSARKFTPVSLGFPRTPVLIRVSQLAKFRLELGSVSLLELIRTQAFELSGENLSGLQANVVNNVCYEAILQQRAVILIDGLDEIVDSMLRVTITQTIESFINDHVLTNLNLGESGQLYGGVDSAIQGNQIVITSREVGYYLAPIDLSAAKHFTILPLNEEQISDMCLKLGEHFDSNAGQNGIGSLFYQEINQQRLRDTGLTRLVSNPLLLTSLFLYFSEKQALPSSRTELYRQLTLDLASRWRSFSGGSSRRQRTEVERNVVLEQVFSDEDNVLWLLSEVADRLQNDKFGNGLVTRLELQDCFTIAFRHLFGYPRSIIDPQVKEDAIEKLVSLTATHLGALIEVGTDVYRFIHLTIQEFLVGWRLARARSDLKHLVDSFQSHRDDPRWREPLLFAFGEIASADRTQKSDVGMRLLEALRKDGTRTSDDLAIFIAELTEEIPESEIVAGAIGEIEHAILHLLECYSHWGIREDRKRRRKLLEDKLARLRMRAREAFDKILLNQIISNSPVAAASAYVLWIRRWLPMSTLEVFSRYLRHDSPDWAWPMHQALRRAVPENYAAEMIPISGLTAPTGDSDSDEELKWYRIGLKSWRRERLAYDQFEFDTIPEIFTESSRFISNHLEHIRSSPELFRLSMALLCPVDDLQAWVWCRQYEWIETFLQKPDAVRNSIIDDNPEDFIPFFGNADPIYNAAVYLDTAPSGRWNRASTYPTFEPRFATCDLSPAAMKILGDDASSRSSVLSQLHQLQRSNDLSDVAIGALGRIFLGDYGFDNSAVSLETIWLAKRTADRLRDASFRALRSKLYSWIQPVDLDDGLTETERCELSRYFAGIYCDCSGSMIPFKSKFRIDVQGLRIQILGDRLASTLLSRNSEALLSNFDSSSEFGESDLSLPCLVARVFDAERVKGTALSQAGPIFWGISENETLESPTFLFSLNSLMILGEDTVEGFADHILKLTGSERTDVLRYLENFDAGMRNLDAPISNTIKFTDGSTSDPFDTANQLEWQLFGAGVVAIELIAKCEEIADSLVIRSPIDAILFLARASTLADNEAAVALMTIALSKLKLVVDEGTQAIFLRRSRGFVESLENGSLQDCWNEQVERLSRPLLRHAAAGTLGYFVASSEFSWNHSEHLGLDPGWVAVSCYATATDFTREVSESADLTSLWKRLGREPSEDSVELLLSSASDRGLTITDSGVEALGSVAERKELGLYRLVGLLGNASVEGLTLLSKIGDGIPHLKNQVAIMSAEQSRTISAEDVEPLIYASRFRDDYPAIRARNMLLSAFQYIERSPRFSVSAQSAHGRSTLEVLAKLAADHRQDQDVVAKQKHAVSALGDWRIDDVDFVRKVFENSEIDVGFGLLESISWTGECQQVVIDWISALSQELREASIVNILLWASRLQVAAKYGRSEPVADHIVECICNIFQATNLSEERFFTEIDSKHSEYSPVLDALVMALERGSLERIPDLANRFLWERLVPIFDVTSDNPASFSATGEARYSWFNDPPERARDLVIPFASEVAFIEGLIAWLDTIWREWLQPPNPITRLRLNIVIEALLCMAVCFARISPNTFTLVASRWGSLVPTLSQICMHVPTQKGHVAAVTLFQWIDDVPLLMHVNDVGHGETTVLSALLSGLRGREVVALRTSKTIPLIRAQGDEHTLLEAFDSLLFSEDERGTVVLAAAQLVRGLIDNAALGPQLRTEALRKLRLAASAAVNRRPLYSSVGDGNKENPVIPVYRGQLSDHISDLLL